MSGTHRRHKSVLYPGSADALAVDDYHEECAQGGDLDSYHQGAPGAWFENPELARQLQMGNQYAAAHLEKLRASDIGYDKPQPFPEKLGTPEWYDARHLDHLRRYQGNPPPPSYYLDYGKKYCLKFSEELFPKLSREGQAWVVSTRMHLQLMLEEILLRDPEGYSEVECQSTRFRNLAFRTHEMAYLRGGLLEVPVQDLLEIVSTPEFEDIATMAGISQILKTVPTVCADRFDELFSEPGLLPSRARIREWTHGTASAPDVPHQDLPELPVDMQCQVAESPS